MSIPLSDLSSSAVAAAPPVQIMLNEHTSRSATAYAWSPPKKWIVLTVMAFCQVSMNFNAAVYSNAVEGINEAFGISNARLGMFAFLVSYAIGCELWAPWSEELGRRPIMQLSLLLTNISILVVALAPSFGAIIGGRILGGLSSAGGSVTLGIVADMFLPDEQQHAVAWASLFSCLGAVIGGITGGPIQQYVPNWRWNPWVQLILGCSTQALHACLGRETRATILLDKEAKKQRKAGNTNVYGPNKGKPFYKRFTLKEVATTMFRPYQMLIFEPVVLFLSILSGFADALIFSFFESYGYVFAQWNFTPTAISLILIPLAASYVVAYLTFFPVIKRHNARRSNGEVLNPEARLKALLYHTVLLPTGLLICAFVATGPPLHWAGIVIASIFIGIANYAIYYATVDYMVAAYGPYSASATGGNGFMRDFLAGMCALYTGPMYKKLGIRNSYLVLFGLATLFCIPVYIFYLKGAAIRARSKFATKLAKEMDKQERGTRTKGVGPERREAIPTSVPASTRAPSPASVVPPTPQEI